MSAQNTQIQTGDIKDLQKNYKFGWFMGSFVDEETPFHSKDFTEQADVLESKV